MVRRKWRQVYICIVEMLLLLWWRWWLRLLQLSIGTCNVDRKENVLGKRYLCYHTYIPGTFGCCKQDVPCAGITGGNTTLILARDGELRFMPLTVFEKIAILYN